MSSEEDRELQGWLSGNPAAQQPPAAGRSAARRRWTGAGLLAAGAVAGGILAGTLGASAATNADNGATTAAAGYSVEGGNAPAAPPGGEGAANGPRGGAGGHGSAPVRSDEKALSSSLTATLTEKAKAAVPGGTVYRVESDAGDAAYEAHMTKSDGTEVTVKFDQNGNVTAVESGMGKGDPAPAGGYRG